MLELFGRYAEPGKTEMMFETIALALQQQKRVCWAIPRADVVIELVPRLKQAFPLCVGDWTAWSL